MRLTVRFIKNIVIVRRFIVRCNINLLQFYGRNFIFNVVLEMNIIFTFIFDLLLVTFKTGTMPSGSRSLKVAKGQLERCSTSYYFFSLSCPLLNYLQIAAIHIFSILRVYHKRIKSEINLFVGIRYKRRWLVKSRISDAARKARESPRLEKMSKLKQCISHKYNKLFIFRAKTLCEIWNMYLLENIFWTRRN